MLLLSISSQWTEVQVHQPPLHFCPPPVNPVNLLSILSISCQSSVNLLSIAHAQVPAAIWAFMELFGEWGGTWSLLLDLTAIVVLLYHTAGCAKRKGRGQTQRVRCAATRVGPTREMGTKLKLAEIP